MRYIHLRQTRPYGKIKIATFFTKKAIHILIAATTTREKDNDNENSCQVQ